MCNSTLAIYCLIDNFLKVSSHREDSRVEVTDAEVITIAINAMCCTLAAASRKAALFCTNLG